MNNIENIKTIRMFLDNVYTKVEFIINTKNFVKEQVDLLKETVLLCRNRSIINPNGDPVATFYFICRANNALLNKQAESLAACCLLYILSLDLFDDVQDEELCGKPHEKVGPAIAINNALALLFLAIDSLREAMELEKNIDKKLEYMKLFNRISLLAVVGQHLDLRGNKVINTPQEVLDMQSAKTSSLGMVSECAAIFSGCDNNAVENYRIATEKMILIVQIVDDIRDIYGKKVSPDLRTDKMTYPVAIFNEIAASHQIEKFISLKELLPDSIKDIRKLFYETKVIKRCAETIEKLRSDIHRLVAKTGNNCAAHRNWLFIIDSLAGTLYLPPPIAESKALQQPEGPWYHEVNELAIEFTTYMKDYNPPQIPRLLPWHLPQWAYIPKGKAVFYPDIEGQSEEIIGHYSELMKIEDSEEVIKIIHHQARGVMAHEFFHYWRDMSGNLTRDFWYEEFVVAKLVTTYIKTYYPSLAEVTVELANKILKRNKELSNNAKFIIDELYKTDYKPKENVTGYDMDMQEVGLVQLKMMSDLYKQDMNLNRVMEELILSN
jgi:geranylgeranyl pyrophosphate synthase